MRSAEQCIVGTQFQRLVKRIKIGGVIIILVFSPRGWGQVSGDLGAVTVEGVVV